MGNVSYSAHISNGKSAITSKSKLLGVAKHNLRKYKSPEYSSDNILLLRGTEDLYQDVKNVYHQEFDEAVQQYNQKQKRADRRIGDYFEHVANLDQDMAVEIIFQCGDKKFWEEHTDKKEKMYNVYAYLLSTMERLLPNFKVANAVIHFDEARKIIARTFPTCYCENGEVFLSHRRIDGEEIAAQKDNSRGS